MGNKLYIGNLAKSVDSNQLTELFNQVGHVTSAKVIVDRYSGESKGFAFVEMSQVTEAQAVIDKFSGEDFVGKRLNISEARPANPMGDRSSSYGSYNRGGRY